MNGVQMSSGPASRPNSSRRGCWTCKRHHRTCDETKPSCTRCKQYGVECEGYGAKRVAFRTAKKRAAAKTRTPQQRKSPRNENNTTIACLKLPSSPPATILSPSPYSPISNIAVNSPAPMDSNQRMLLARFLSDFAPLRALSPLQNIFEEDIAPLAVGHDHVRTAIVAVTSALRHKDIPSTSTCRTQLYKNAIAFEHYEEAVQLLRRSVDRVEQGNEVVSSKLKTSTEDIYACLAATYLLTWFEVLVYDPQKWAVHLEALCGLINRSGPSLLETTFGRRLLHAVARLDCQNALSNRGRPLLEYYWYEILESDPVRLSPIIKKEDHDGHSTNFTPQELEAMSVEYCMKLHGLLGSSAFLSYQWTTNTPLVMSGDLREQVKHVLDRLTLWYQSLPVALRWPGDVDDGDADNNFPYDVPDGIIDRQLRTRSHLQKMILLHYYAIRVHLYHMLDPVRIPRLMRLSVNLSQKCLYIIRSLDDKLSIPIYQTTNHPTGTGTDNRTYNKNRSQFPSDMPVSFVFAVIGVVFRDPPQRKWISEYLMRLGREGIWCGYERALCLHAWWQSDDATPASISDKTTTTTKSEAAKPFTKRLIKSIPLRHQVPNESLTPDIGMGVDILYENLETGETGIDHYYFNPATMQSQLVSTEI